MMISKANEKDIPLLNTLVNSAYRGDSSRRGWTTEADLLDGIRTDEVSLSGMINDPEAVILTCCSEDGSLSGCVYLRKKEEQVYLGMLTVSPELQDKGIGKTLLCAAEKHAKEKGCTAIVMTVISVRQELIDWYMRHGYLPTGETEPFPADPSFGLPKEHLFFIVLQKKIE